MRGVTLSGVGFTLWRGPLPPRCSAKLNHLRALAKPKHTCSRTAELMHLRALAKPKLRSVPSHAPPPPPFLKQVQAAKMCGPSSNHGADADVTLADWRRLGAGCFGTQFICFTGTKVHILTLSTHLNISTQARNRWSAPSESRW